MFTAGPLTAFTNSPFASVMTLAIFTQGSCGEQAHASRLAGAVLVLHVQGSPAHANATSRIVNANHEYSLLIGLVEVEIVRTAPANVLMEAGSPPGRTRIELC